MIIFKNSSRYVKRVEFLKKEAYLMKDILQDFERNGGKN
jgi:hypothetical protein